MIMIIELLYVDFLWKNVLFSLLSKTAHAFTDFNYFGFWYVLYQNTRY